MIFGSKNCYTENWNYSESWKTKTIHLWKWQKIKKIKMVGETTEFQQLTEKGHSVNFWVYVGTSQISRFIFWHCNKTINRKKTGVSKLQIVTLSALVEIQRLNQMQNTLINRNMEKVKTDNFKQKEKSNPRQMKHNI